MKRLFISLILCISAVYAAKSPSEKVILCVACHGDKGISAQPQWPNLAGQNQRYLLKQLKDIQKGTHRQVPEMSGILTSFSDQDMESLAQYYDKMPSAVGQTPKVFVKRGEQLYRGGDLVKHIPACMACHEPQGTGNAQAGFPALSGQKAIYTLQQLLAFKKGKRNNDLNHIMQDICQKMSNEDMEAVAHYVEGLY